MPVDTIKRVDEWIDKDHERIDLMLVVGTSAKVYPAASYIETARRAGARIAVIDMERPGTGVASNLRKGDWFFGGDAGEILPGLLGSKQSGNL